MSSATSKPPEPARVTIAPQHAAPAPAGQGHDARPASALWSAGTAIVLVAVLYLGVLYASTVIFSLYAHLRHWSPAYAANWLNNSVAAQFGYVLLSEGLILSLLWAFIRFRKYHGVRKALGLERPQPEDAVYAMAGTVVYFVLYLVVINIAASFTHINLNQQQDVGFQIVRTHSDLLLTFLSLVVLPPLAEETLFRGFLFNGLRRSTPFMTATIVTSVLFAAPHLLESNGGGLLWSAGIDTFVLSLVLCYVREKTGRLWAGMVMHGLKNFLAFYVLFIHH